MIGVEPAPGRRVVFLRDMVLDARIGWFPHEHGRTQRVRITVALAVAEGVGPARDLLRDVVDYDRLVRLIRGAAGGEHVRLVETLAERVAGLAFFDDRIEAVGVRVEKLDVYPDVGSVGVEIARRRA